LCTVRICGFTGQHQRLVERRDALVRAALNLGELFGVRCAHSLTFGADLGAVLLKLTSQPA
jgi:hypothetical protein